MASLASRCFARTITQREEATVSGQSAMAATGQILLSAHIGCRSEDGADRVDDAREVPVTEDAAGIVGAPRGGSVEGPEGGGRLHLRFEAGQIAREIT